jgi:hypothetical protein
VRSNLRRAGALVLQHDRGAVAAGDAIEFIEQRKTGLFRHLSEALRGARPAATVVCVA